MVPVGSVWAYLANFHFLFLFEEKFAIPLKCKGIKLLSGVKRAPMMVVTGYCLKFTKGDLVNGVGGTFSPDK